jgi:hypothetical protein
MPPGIFRYGSAAPFVLQRLARGENYEYGCMPSPLRPSLLSFFVIHSTHPCPSVVGLNSGILIVWVAISCVAAAFPVVGEEEGCAAMEAGGG